MTESTNSPIVYAEDLREDSESMRAAFIQTRTRNELLIFPDGEQARHYFEAVLDKRHEFPSLILVDLTLPKMSGLNLIRWIREQAHLKVIPLVALSRTYDFDELEQVYEYGANLYLLKPRELRQWADLVFRLQGYWSTQGKTELPQLI
jgi:DNA-binding response OmpR family regulator